MKFTCIINKNGIASLRLADIRYITVPVTDLDYSKIATLGYVPKV